LSDHLVTVKDVIEEASHELRFRAQNAVRIPTPEQCELGFLPFFDDPLTLVLQTSEEVVPLAEFKKTLAAHHELLREKDDLIVHLAHRIVAQRNLYAK